MSEGAVGRGVTFTATYYARKLPGGNRRVVAVRTFEVARRRIAEGKALVWLDYERRHHRGEVVTVTVKRSKPDRSHTIPITDDQDGVARGGD